MIKLEIDDYTGSISDKLTKYCNSSGTQYTLNNIRAIVLHKNPVTHETIEQTIERELLGKFSAYHFVIDEDGKIANLVDLEYPVKHSRSSKYTTKATEYFGENLCPAYEESATRSHPEISADNCTISILLPNMEKMTSNVRAAIINLVAYLENGVASGLTADLNLMTQYYINGDTDEIIPMIKEPEDFLSLKLDIERKRIDARCDSISKKENPYNLILTDKTYGEN